jgi:hypothetical protein
VVVQTSEQGGDRGIAAAFGSVGEVHGPVLVGDFEKKFASLSRYREMHAMHSHLISSCVCPRPHEDDAPQHPEWKDNPLYAAVLAGDMKASLREG